MNRARLGLAERAEEWKGSSIREYAGVDADGPESRRGLEIDPAWRDFPPMPRSGTRI